MQTAPDLPIIEPKSSGMIGLYRTEILSGLTVALALVPEAVAFSFVPLASIRLSDYMPPL